MPIEISAYSRPPITRGEFREKLPSERYFLVMDRSIVWWSDPMYQPWTPLAHNSKKLNFCNHHQSPSRSYRKVEPLKTTPPNRCLWLCSCSSSMKSAMPRGCRGHETYVFAASRSSISTGFPPLPPHAASAKSCEWQHFSIDKNQKTAASIVLPVAKIPWFCNKATCNQRSGLVI